VKPATVIAWHHKGFRLFWTWKIWGGRTGRPEVPLDVRDLIRRMSRENLALTFKAGFAGNQVFFLAARSYL
jgi:hypothetical protein